MKTTKEKDEIAELTNQGLTVCHMFKLLFFNVSQVKLGCKTKAWKKRQSHTRVVFDHGNPLSSLVPLTKAKHYQAASKSHRKILLSQPALSCNKKITK